MQVETLRQGRRSVEPARTPTLRGVRRRRGFREAGSRRQRHEAAGSSVGSTPRGSPRSARPRSSRSWRRVHLGGHTAMGAVRCSRTGKPRRASGASGRQRVDITTDSTADQSLEATRLRTPTARGHATTATWKRLQVEGNALKGLTPRERRGSVTGMCVPLWKPGEPQGRQGDATSSRCCGRRNPSRW